VGKVSRKKRSSEMNRGSAFRGTGKKEGSGLPPNLQEQGKKNIGGSRRLPISFARQRKKGNIARFLTGRGKSKGENRSAKERVAGKGA